MYKRIGEHSGRKLDDVDEGEGDTDVVDASEGASASEYVASGVSSEIRFFLTFISSKFKVILILKFIVKN